MIRVGVVYDGACGLIVETRNRLELPDAIFSDFYAAHGIPQQFSSSSHLVNDFRILENVVEIFLDIIINLRFIYCLAAVVENPQAVWVRRISANDLCSFAAFLGV